MKWCVSVDENELITLAQDGGNPKQVWAQEELLNKYRSMVKVKARSYYLVGASTEDVMQEGMIGLFQAICIYKPDKGASFATFANLCVKRKILQAINLANRDKHKALNLAESLDDKNNENLMAKVEAFNVEISPEEKLIGKEESAAFLERLQKSLTKMEKEVLTLYLQGLSYAEIAQKLVLQEKSVDNAIQRIRKKIQ
ncbi:MAG: sigma-70 family RNA polymerase sigma factor [Acidaminococcaceae bacterium]|nr:sigma-70 family RNA polymerase sigma factor [Acidaminococcaceae bacterium]